MKTYLVDQPDQEHSVEYTEDQILEEYWEYWEKKMIKKYGENHHLINESNCITDWLVTNWAWEKRTNEV